MSHECPNPDCDKPVPAEFFACRRHWFFLPLNLRRAVWATARAGRRRLRGPLRRAPRSARPFQPREDSVKTLDNLSALALLVLCAACIVAAVALEVIW